MGMTSIWDANGERIPCTILHLDGCFVYNQVLKPHLAVQVACTPRKPKNVSNAMLQVFRQAGVPPCLRMTEFKVDKDALVPVGSKLRAAHFVPGQYLDVQARTIGKGFQGGMKRWNFAGQPASHGTTKAHRKIGSLGASTTPGRVHRGKKMPGRMGGLNRTLHGSLLIRIDTELDLLFIKGPVPGPRGGYVRVRDSMFKPPNLDRDGILGLPFPAGTEEVFKTLATLPKEVTLDKMSKRDPHAPITNVD